MSSFPFEKESQEQDVIIQSPSNGAKKPLSFDCILNHHVKFGKYQYISAGIIILISVAEGAEALVLSFLIPVLTNLWGLNDTQQSLLGSSTFIGFFFGSLVSGQFSDRWGRRPPMVIASLVNFGFAVGSSFANNFTTLVILRLIFGVSVGILSPISATYLIEICPTNIRGKIFVLTGLFWSFGALITCVIAYLSLDSFTTGNWRALLLFSSVPSLISLIIIVFWLEESPRFLIFFQEYEKGFALLEKAIRSNGKSKRKTLSEEERQALRRWSEHQLLFLKGNTRASPAELFKEGRYKITPLLWMMWFALSAIYYGNLFILPSILREMKMESTTHMNDFMEMFLSVLSEFPSGLVAFFIIEIKWLGRKNSLLINYFLGTVFSLAAFWTRGTAFLVLATAVRIFLNMNFLFIYPFTTEIYPTVVRTTGLGMASACARIGGISIPWIVIASIRISVTGPFLIFAILGVLATLSTVWIGEDTTGKELDRHKGEEDNIFYEKYEEDEQERLTD